MQSHIRRQSVITHSTKWRIDGCNSCFSTSLMVCMKPSFFRILPNGRNNRMFCQTLFLVKCNSELRWHRVLFCGQKNHKENSCLKLTVKNKRKLLTKTTAHEPRWAICQAQGEVLHRARQTSGHSVTNVALNQPLWDARLRLRTKQRCRRH